MLLVSRLFTAEAFRFKAPKNKMYNVTGVAFNNQSAVSATIFVFDQLLEDEVTIFTGRKSPLVSFRADADGSNFYVNDINHKTKYLTIAKNTGSVVSCNVTIYGEIIKATRLELVMEWFRKGR